MRCTIPIVCVVLTAASTASGAIVWDEAVNGDLSGDRLNPTALALSIGTNTIKVFSIGGDREYVSFTLPMGAALTLINHTEWDSDDNVAFIAVQAGSTFTEPHNGVNVANLLGYSHFGSGSVGEDILQYIATGAGSQGFTPPLTGPVYTFWMQETSSIGSSYTLDFIVTPAPGAAVSTLLAVGMLASRRRR